VKTAVPVLTALTATQAVAVGGGLAGGYIGYLVHHDGQDGAVWISDMKLVEFNSQNLEALNCDVIVGLQEPGITTRPIDD